jgi:signal transduction histidine kinase
VPLPWYLRPPTLIAGTLLVAGAAAVAWRLRLEAALRVERERTRIAMDLHDDLGAGLSTITMLTGLAASDDLSDEARREVAGEAATAAATLTDALAAIVWTLRRDAGSGGTLSRSLVERGRRLFASGETRFVVDVAEEWPQRPLPLALYRNLQLIGYEALGNAAKHAGAREVTLRFHPWTLEIADDGRGLSAVSPRAGTGTGLPSMRARAAAVGAKLEVADRPGGGTIVRVTFRP